MEMTSARVTVIVGSVLLSLGILLSAFTPNVYTLYLTFGFIAGKPCTVGACSTRLFEKACEEPNKLNIWIPMSSYIW